MITFDSVTKTYPDGTTAVDTLDLTIEEGSFTAFVGPSGCGKTTSMRMINRMIDPTSGTVSVDGNDVSTVNPVTLRRGIGYVIQSAGLMPHQRIVDNVATVPVLQGVSRKQARNDAIRLLERVGLDPSLANRFPAQLSGGQQQRVGVARALAADPAILLMDEPFSAVDPVVREDLQNEMLRLQGELRKTIVFVTHDIDEAVKLADRIAIFGSGGRLHQYDTPERLLAAPADDFVSGFVGRDRGYRLLQFSSGSDVALEPLAPITESGIDALDLGPDEWRLVLVDGRPFGWVDADGVRAHAGGAGVYDSCSAGGSLFVEGGTLRQALDAALSSPSGLGVVVDSGGTVTGGVRAADVLGVIERERKSVR
ncbi:ABC transporter ATP-binding protein [Williamsia phyllosphaerae]|uniref:Proline/glycine betaine ABC transporter ATP-binding protein n=1 Tax=Williamsia phyllosphaerae TaxID=885042 RepID=A0ABQ1UJ00_9NOCA|nr:ABC transporter ATP-binding protein [Williamsia phyllosphaerae]GGF19220.1 proline/glycine betaine ABC transporter ATP-binding protein [Williamsia phyllosphaerae]